ncbi:YybH family protein [Ruicaihuangia caeni]|uniref:YybH family protein n=1 Tax=Ruicaihuangia caeni TaxID=3042517 RepID=UPI00339073E2
MTTRTPTESEVLAAASAIVDAFAATDTERYFAGFARDATFLFHTEPQLLDTPEYEDIWKGWVADGWRVLECRSSERRVQTFPGGAVFTHHVFTRVDTGDGEDAYEERETIVFSVDDDGLIAVHEHLSPMPQDDNAEDDANDE